MNDAPMTRKHRALSGIAVWAIAALVGIGVLWIAISYANDQRDVALRKAILRQRTATVAACKRGNILRSHGNVTGAILKEFLLTARTARLAAVNAPDATREDKELNQKAADRYTFLIPLIERSPLIDCETAYPKP